MKQNNSSSPQIDKAQGGTPNTPAKNKKGGKSDKVETPTKNRKRGQDKTDEPEEEKDLGIFKKKRERAEVRTNISMKAQFEFYRH